MVKEHIKHTKYDVARAPFTIAKKAAKAVFWPVEVAKTLATSAADTAFKVVGVSTEDAPLASLGGNESIYDLANDNLNYSAIIYYYTELRTHIKQKVLDLAVEKGLSTESAPGEPSQLMLLHNAIMFKIEAEERVKSEDMPESESTEMGEALTEYKTSVVQLGDLAKKLNLDHGDLKIFTTYVDILRNPKSMQAIKADLTRYDHVIEPNFRLIMGGTAWNRSNVDELIEGGKDIYVHYIDDVFNSTSFDPFRLKNALKVELVWAIIVNKTDKKITVVFRGTTNPNDGIKDLSVNMKDCMLPGFVSQVKEKNKTKFGRVHTGFYDYLFDETAMGPNGSTKSKGEEIIGMLRADFFDKAEFDDYSLVVTGHSLGASLSTLFSFRCACMNEPFRLVTNVSFASPFLGDEEFRKLFTKLEIDGKIRHLRVSNYEDAVPLLPICNFPFGLNLYKHVGMNIRLYDDQFLNPANYRRFYPKLGSIMDSARNAMHNNVPLGLTVGVGDNHFCNEYDKRLNLQKTKDQLSMLTLEGLYADKDITGWP